MRLFESPRDAHKYTCIHTNKHISPTLFRSNQQEEDFQRSGDSIMDRVRELGSKMDGLEQSKSGVSKTDCRLHPNRSIDIYMESSEVTVSDDVTKDVYACMFSTQLTRFPYILFLGIIFVSFVRFVRSFVLSLLGISGLVQDAGLEEEEDEEEDYSKYDDDDQAEGNTVAASSPERRPPSTSSPSHNNTTSDRVQL